MSFIAYKNLLRDGTLSASSETTGAEKENGIDFKAYDWWTPSGTGNQTLAVALTTNQNADYLGVAAHTLGANGARVALEYGDGTDWQQHGDLLAPEASESVMMKTAALSENLLTDSQDFSGAGWSFSNSTLTANNTTAPNDTYSATKWECTINGVTAFSHPIGFYSGEQRTYSIYMKQGNVSLVYVQFLAAVFGVESIYSVDLNAGSIAVYSGDNADYYSITNVGSGWYRIVFTATATVHGASTQFCNIYLSAYNPATAGDYIYIWGAQEQSGATASTYSRTFSESLKGGASNWRAKFYAKQNDYTYSDQFDNAVWGKVGSTISANAIQGPSALDSGTNADKMVESALNEVHRIERGSITAGRNTFSCYVKSAERDSFDIRFYNVTDNTATARFDLSEGTGTRLDGGPHNITITAIGDGWYRCSSTRISTVTDQVRFGIDVNGYLGDGTSGIYIFGAQLEQAPSVGPYQATTTAAVTNSIGSVGQVSIGEALALPTGQTTGFTPPTLAPKDKVLNSKSNGGVLLGRSVERQGEEFTISLRNLTEAWVRANWTGLYDHAIRYPFFFAWDYDRYPTEVSYCWTMGDIDGPSYRSHDRLEGKLKVSADK